MNKKRVLEIGSGRNYYKNKPGESVTHLDIVKLPHVEVVHDLKTFPYPFKNDTFDIIIASHVLEHINDLIQTMSEIHRVAKPKGIIKVRVPYFGSPNAFADPTHKNFFTKKSFDYWDKTTDYGQDYNHEVQEIFKVTERKLNFGHSVWSRLASQLEMRKPRFYEICLSRIIPAPEIFFELIVEK